MTAPLDWQTLLFVPVGADRHLASAIRHRPDAIILDLEDAIGQDDKPAARRQLAACQHQVVAAGIGFVVRINTPLAMMVEDIAALDRTALSALLVPKVESHRPLDNAAELAAAPIPLIALVESPAGVVGLDGIAGMTGLAGLMLGSEDLSAALGVDPNGGALRMPAARIAMAAAAEGLLAIGFPGSIGNFRDLDLYRRQIEEGRNLGFGAVAAIHPAQLPVIREALAPSAADIAWAQSIVDKAGTGEGPAVAAIDGIMIDAPVLARARRLLARTGPVPLS